MKPFYISLILVVAFITLSFAQGGLIAPQQIEADVFTKPYMSVVNITSNTNNTYFTILDTVTGTGMLNQIIMRTYSENSETVYIKITIDGAEYVFNQAVDETYSNWSRGILGQTLPQGGSFCNIGRSIYLPLNVKFKTSMKVECKSVSGSDRRMITRIIYLLK